MVSIRNNRPAPVILNYSGGRNGQLFLNPGVNINVPGAEWEHAKKHPTVKIYIEHGVLDVLTSEPDATLELEGFNVVDDPKTDEPLPVTEAKIGKRPKAVVDTEE